MQKTRDRSRLWRVEVNIISRSQSRHSRKGNPLSTSSRKETLKCTWQTVGGLKQTSHSVRGGSHNIVRFTSRNSSRSSKYWRKILSSIQQGKKMGTILKFHSSILPGKSQGQRNQAVYSPWGCESGHNLSSKPPPPYILSFHYYHLIVNIDTCIFKCKFPFHFRP